MKRVRIARSAVADLDEIWLYIAERDGIEAAERVIDSITGKFPLLSRQQKAGRSRPDIGEGIRSFVVRPYRIYYRIDGSFVRVLYVRHAARAENLGGLS